MTEYNETALVLEGGGNRGVFTAGVLDYLMEQKVEFPYVVEYQRAPAMPWIMYPGR